VRCALGASPAPAKSEEAVKRNNFGAELLKQGRLEEAIREFQRAVEVDPTYAAAAFNLAYAYDRGGRIEERLRPGMGKHPEAYIAKTVSPVGLHGHARELGGQARHSSILDLTSLAARWFPPSPNLNREVCAVT
jgi:tetratricopeptide (TPR) repeat protein